MVERIAGGQHKTHVSLDYSKMDWNWEELVAEAKTWKAGDSVNWTDTARKYGVHAATGTSTMAKNGGQIVKEVLRDNGIDVGQFLTGKNRPTDDPRKQTVCQAPPIWYCVPIHNSACQPGEKKRELL